MNDDTKELYEVIKPKTKKKSSKASQKSKYKEEATKDKAKEKKPEPIKLISFDMWFRSLGRPTHHKNGMKAFAKTKGKKSKEAWDRLFENYFKSH